ncbi:HK97 family phage prohead protease [Phascolarctobacterium succinatutens]|uniref:HK97 family phage prohead protease n=1 Tax=Phascolarctobacterium succinatutens TaxID=626940 RepID=UPI0023F77EEE|nr:HK97 family phage prohead protease [Phascolarctobacterium succinatutens]
MKVEIRKDGTALITGYVNVVGRESRVLQDISGEFVEVIEPGTFARALSKVDSVGLMFNHMRDVDTADNTFELTEDNIGLYAKAVIKDAEVIQRAKENKLTGWSFGFYENAEKWDNRADGMRRRTVTDLDLVEVSILDVTPAYIATSIEMRGEDAVLKECRDVGDTVEIVDNSPKDEPPAPDLSKQEQLKRKFDFYLMCN